MIPVWQFQSQTRSRPSCHGEFDGKRVRVPKVSISNEKPPQLPRKGLISMRKEKNRVSISNEKPPQLPHASRLQSAKRFIVVSISNEKPPQLPLARATDIAISAGFQSQTRSRPSCHMSSTSGI